jgi:hypothetical protein
LMQLCSINAAQAKRMAYKKRVVHQAARSGYFAITCASVEVEP